MKVALLIGTSSLWTFTCPRSNPTAAYEVADGVEVVIRLLVFCPISLLRHGLDRELEVLAVGIEDLGNAGPVLERAAVGGRTGPVVEHAARLVRERDRVDLPGPRIGGDRCCRDQDEDKNAAPHGVS